MTDTPTPMTPDTLQELGRLNSELAALNAAGDAGRLHEFEQRGGVDGKLLLLSQIDALTRGGAVPGAAQARAPEEAPRLGAILSQYDAPLSSLGQRLVPALEQAFDPAVHGELSVALRVDLPRIADEVKMMSAPPRLEETEATLRAAWGNKYDEHIRYADCAWDHLPDSARAEINRLGLRWHPDTLRLLSKIGGRMLGADGHDMTDQGLKWTLERGAEDHAEREREKAETAESDRRARELRFG